MNKSLLLFSLIFMFTAIEAQILEDKNWCMSKCDAAGDEMQNAKMLYGELLKEGASRANLPSLRFPLRFGVVRQANATTDFDNRLLNKVIVDLNHAFESAGFTFYIDRIDVLVSDLYIEQLSDDFYQPYNAFSAEHDIQDMISVYIFDHGHEFCDISETRISCARRGGFSYILSSLTNNIVLSSFDLLDQKVVAHEFGHFFGLFHTFEESMFGKDDFDPVGCDMLGDCICDTPPDPGGVFEVYVNYSACRMMGLSHENGQVYQPLINNYMSYFKPCYLKEYQFSSGQLAAMTAAGHCDLRVGFSR